MEMHGWSDWATRISDQRGKRVVFLAHCLLNQNTRYLGGALGAGPVPEVLQACLDGGIGIVQLPCPEQYAWGGVLKRRLLLIYGSNASVLFRAQGILLWLALCYTRRVYRRLARETAAQILDYQNTGHRVLGVIGVDGSPTCGVNKTLDIKQVVIGLANFEQQTVNADRMNKLIIASARNGQGLYIASLKHALEQLGVKTAMTAYDLIAELDSEQSLKGNGAPGP